MSDEPRAGELHGGCVLERPLGRGGMGAVWTARAPDGRAVVVKFMTPEAAGDPTLVARFRREGEALRRLARTPHVVEVLGVAADGPRPCLVLELVLGTSCDAALAQAGRLAPLVAARVARDVARGLAALHAHGILHRDVKPANIVVRQDGTATLVDLGVAKDQFRTGMTAPGELVGTAQYLAPEVWEEAAPDERTDLFALGATLHHLVAGAPPFEGDDLDAVADAILSGAQAPLAEAAPDAPRDLGLVVALALQTDRAQRYARAEDVAADLDRVLAGQPVEVPALVDGASVRWPLLPGDLFTLGSEDGCEVVVPGAAPRHAQVRREPAGFVLYALRSGSGAAVAGPGGRPTPVEPGAGRPLADGELVHLGRCAPLVFRDPRRVGHGGTLVQDAPRVEVPPALCEALADLGDPHAALLLLERLAPDRALPDDDRALAALLGPNVAQAAARRRGATLAQAAQAALGALAALAGGPADLAGWLGWWHQVRTTAPPQAVPPGLTALVLRAPPALQVTLPARGALLVGRDERCAVRLPGGPRLAATFVRLARRVAVVDAGAGATAVHGAPVRAALVDPGDVVRLGEVEVALEGPPPPPAAPAAARVQPATLEALAALGHPAAAAGLVATLAGLLAARAALPAAAPALGLDPRAVAARLGERAQATRALLGALLGGDGGPDPAGWGPLLAGRPGPAILPAGWA